MSDPDIKLIQQWKIEGDKPDWTEVSPCNVAVKFYYHVWDTLFAKSSVI